MDWIRTLLSRCAALAGNKKLDADLDDELCAHIELAAAERMSRGQSPVEARQAALRDFGGVTQTRERYRTQRGLTSLEVLAQDLHFGARMLMRNPGFTAIAVLTLALGIGGNTAIFSIVNAVLLNPLPFPQSDQLVALHESKPNFRGGSISYPNFLDWRKENRTFSALALSRPWSFSMTGRGEAEQFRGQYLSSGFFAVFSVRPVLGREFGAEEEVRGAPPVALISEGLWRRKFSASPDALGQVITLDGRNFSIVGVIPASFRVQFSNFQERDVYVPIAQWDNPQLLNRGGGLGFHGVGRLKLGVTIEQARADMDRVTHDLAAAYPGPNHGIGAYLLPLKEEIVGDARPLLLMLLAAVGFVLLIACVNVASLMLARSAVRSREFAVRAALGASRKRVIRQLLTESLLLSLFAGALGVVAAALGTRAAVQALPAALPRASEVGIDPRVLVFTMAVSLLTGIVFGVAPALRTSRANPQDALRTGGRGAVGAHARALGGFVVIEMAIALILLSGAGLMIRSLVRLWNVDPGFNPHGVLNFGVALPPSINGATPDGIRNRYREVVRQFASTPGITAASETWGAIPLSGEDDTTFWRDDQPKPQDDQHMSWTLHYVVEPDYMRVMQLPLERGRFFANSDNEHAPLVAVVDDIFARKYFSGEDPIGKFIDLAAPVRKVEIVGIVGHVNQWGLDSDDSQSLRAELYLPCMQMPDQYIASSPTWTNLIVRYDGSLSSALEALRRTNRQMSNEQVIFNEQTMESIISDSIASRRFAMILLGVFAALAVLLACIGIYGIMAYLVSQRAQEVGIRMALGAPRSHVLMMVFRNGATLAATGAVIGIGGALLLTRQMGSLLFSVSPSDPLTLALVSVVVVLVALAACIIPARRAASIDPMRALRIE